jgi:hypothetical protein
VIPIALFFLVAGNIFETEDNRNFEILLAGLEELREDPVDLNTAGFDDLSRIPYLTPNDIIKVIDHRQRFGYFDLIRDLLKVPGFNRILVSAIEPYVRISVRKFKVRSGSVRIRGQQAWARSGSEEFYTATKTRWNDYRLTLITEQDPYETSYLDYLACGLTVNEDHRTFALGKYDLDLGSGILFSAIGTFFQGLDFQMISHERGIIPHSSTRENGGLFGAALSDSLPIRYTVFYSHQALDGRVDSLGRAWSLDESGEHADSASRLRRDRIQEELFGYDLKRDLGGLRLSHTAYWCGYSPPFVAEDSFRRFYGDRFWMTGLNLRHAGPGYALFGEIARADRNRIGGLFGFSGAFPVIDFNLAGKYFPDGFYSPKGIEADDGRCQMNITVADRSPVADLSAGLNLTEYLSEDSTRYDCRINLGREIGRFDARLILRWQFDEKFLTLNASRAVVRFQPRDPLYFELRLEDKHCNATVPRQRGVFGALEAGLDLKRWSARIRYGLFDTDSYLTRIIAYEPGLPGTVNNRPLYDRGRYGFLLVTLKPADLLAFNVKFSVLERDSLSCHIGGQVDVKW